MNGYYVAAALVAPACMAAEHVFARRRGITAYRFGDTLASASNFIGELVLTAVLQLNIFAAYAWTVDRVALLELSPSSPLTWIVAFFALDFVYYVGHRACHRVAALWALHSVHHQSGEYNLATGLRGPWLSALQIAPFMIFLAVAGFPAEVLFPIYAVQTVYKLLVHTRLVGKLGIFERVFVTPSSHRVHHASNAAYVDKNFGGVLAIWDKLFGTHADEDEPARFAPGAAFAGDDTIENNVGPWRAIVRRVRTDGLFHAVFGRPVHEPVQVAAQPTLQTPSSTRLRAVLAIATITSSALAIALLSFDGLGMWMRFALAALAFAILALVGRTLRTPRSTEREA
jgi:sterol desaturase/sphingolipid hydroxylase (fatty acid hydroxylase superfamily)